MSEFDAGIARLSSLAQRLDEGEVIDTVTVREILSWFGVKRRGTGVVEVIRRSLRAKGLQTEPDFESAYIDGPVQIIRDRSLSDVYSGSKVSVDSIAVAVAEPRQPSPSTERIDPTHRISKLAAANNPPVYVAPDASITEALTIMLSRGFSQLPVMTTPRDVKGVVSWQSIGARLGMGKSAIKVREAMEPHQEVKAESSIFQVIPVIVANDYVLVRSQTNSITGIVTASDLSLQFLQLSEPFLLLSEIENQMREFIGRKFSIQDLKDSKDPADQKRTIEQVSDLAFGEYIRLLENTENWTKSGVPLDRAIFCEQLNKVREIRNDVMHFDPDGISSSDLENLREFARFLQKISSMGIT